MMRGGRKFTGCVSGVASSTSFHILIDLSHSAVMRRLPVWSKDMSRIPHSDSNDPGCRMLSVAWKLLEDFQSQNLRHSAKPSAQTVGEDPFLTDR